MNPVSSFLMRFAILVFIFAVAACSSYDRSYHKSASLAPLKLPDSSNSEAFVELYPVPVTEGQSGILFDKPPLPPATGLRSGLTAVAFEQEPVYWLRTNLPPSTTWSQLLNFWQQQGVNTVSQDLQAATMTTAWFKKAMQPGYEIRYGLRFDRGLQFRSSEVTVYNQSRKTSASAAQANVPQVVDNVNHARLILDEMQDFLNSQPDPATDSFLASTLDLPARVNYLDSPVEPSLELDLDDRRLYGTVVNALSKGDLHLFEGSPDAGILYFQQYDADKKPGFFSRLNPASKVGKKPETRFSLAQLLNQLDWSDESVINLFSDRFKARQTSTAVNAPGYLLALSTQADGLQNLKVRDTRGLLLPRDEALQLLELIRLQLL